MSRTVLERASGSRMLGRWRPPSCFPGMALPAPRQIRGEEEERRARRRDAIQRAHGLVLSLREVVEPPVVRGCPDRPSSWSGTPRPQPRRPVVAKTEPKKSVNRTSASIRLKKRGAQATTPARLVRPVTPWMNASPMKKPDQLKYASSVLSTARGARCNRRRRGAATSFRSAARSRRTRRAVEHETEKANVRDQERPVVRPSLDAGRHRECEAEQEEGATPNTHGRTEMRPKVVHPVRVDGGQRRGPENGRTDQQRGRRNGPESQRPWGRPREAPRQCAPRSSPRFVACGPEKLPCERG
jgi:hypothetical protein